jgi:O-antigen/teichoic acid export membrane protein
MGLVRPTRPRADAQASGDAFGRNDPRPSETPAAGALRSSMLVFASSVASKGLLALLAFVLIRYLAPPEYARLTLATAWIATVTGCVTATANKVFIVGIGRPAFRGASPSSFVGLQLAVVGALSLLAAPFALREGALVGFGALLVAAFCLVDFAQTASQQELRFGYHAKLEFVRSLALLVAVTAVLLLESRGAKAWEVLGIQAVATLALAVVVWRRRLELRAVLRISDAARLAASIWRSGYGAVSLYFIILAVSGQTDVFMLSALGSGGEVAAYGSATRYYALFMLALGAVNIVQLPVMRRARSYADIDDVYRRHWRLVPIFAAGAFGVMYVAQWVMPWVDRGRYPEAVNAFRILAASSVVSFALSPHAVLPIILEDFRFIVKVALGAWATAIVLHLVLIPRWHVTGAAVAAAVGFAAQNTIVWGRARWHRRRQTPLPDSPAEPMAATAGSGAA